MVLRTLQPDHSLNNSASYFTWYVDIAFLARTDMILTDAAIQLHETEDTGACFGAVQCRS
jgi:hypothetical protein